MKGRRHTRIDISRLASTDSVLLPQTSALRWFRKPRLHSLSPRRRGLRVVAYDELPSRDGTERSNPGIVYLATQPYQKPAEASRKQQRGGGPHRVKSRRGNAHVYPNERERGQEHNLSRGGAGKHIRAVVSGCSKQ